ncbi:AMP-binding protein [Fulvivirgaceae bacterium PWU4]|uniref:AMP-binding protein n=1 Tax=Chryseosolibacter histidini TaxID=2782349 RepID=A0AAP2DMG2_9BACT|nr:AMP-binding protein [Chryseosolibacter histidini]MBT1699048.1 AMP-binding protein [Chryseosolibacter histidini]
MALSDAERFPLIQDLSHLRSLQQDACAPSFNFRSGDRLQSHHLQQVTRYAATIGKQPFWNDDTQPTWMESYLDWCARTVPFYKGRATTLSAQPTISRSDLQTTPWQFVSSDSNLDDLLVYQTSGTTGAPMDVIFDPVSQACWIPQLESVLNRYGIRLSRGTGHTAIALICDQQSTLTYASLSAYLGGAGVIKVNLNPLEWKDPDHRKQYLEKLNPEILTGDPFAFLSLLALAPRLSPKALVSSAMKLTEGVRNKLESFFRCPVLDIYSLTECRMIAVAEGTHRHRAIRPELFLEIFDPVHDIPLKPGERGELVITGGNNPFLPLIRYRTGDFCSISIDNSIPYLIDLEARAPVAYYRADHTFVNYVDISRTMTELPLAGFSVHQHTDKSVTFKGWSSDASIKPLVHEKLSTIFGTGVSVDVTILPFDSQRAKPVTYASDFKI